MTFEQIVNKITKEGDEHYALVILKPDLPLLEKRGFRKFCAENSLKIIANKRLKLSIPRIVGLYPTIFNALPDDIQYGTKWKAKVFDYLQSGCSICYIVFGDSAKTKLNSYKRELRKKYNKITHPQQKLNQDEFERKVIKNLVHVADTDHLLASIWLLFKSA